MAFKNRIRLPFYLTRPQFPREANVFRRADGSTKVQSVIIKKVFEGETDNLPKEIHERLIIALSHDEVTVEGRFLLSGVSLDGDYDIDWNKFLDYPLAKAAFKAQVTPFNYSNDNCKTCEEVSQVVCVDDNIGTVNEDETITVHVLANDSICCKPVVISLVTYNTDYLDSCVISGDDIIIHTKASLPDATNVILVTYRAQCPNGSYDEANVIGDIDGSLPSCLAPTNLVVTDTQAQQASFDWDSITGAVGYDWNLYKLVDLITIIDSGSTVPSGLTITGLEPNTTYRLFLRTDCGGGSASNYVYVDFTTNAATNEFCGQYSATNNTLFLLKFVTYMDCNNNIQTIGLLPHETRIFCALQSSPGVPINITTSGTTTITYLGLC